MYIPIVITIIKYLLIVISVLIIKLIIVVLMNYFNVRDYFEGLLILTLENILTNDLYIMDYFRILIHCGYSLYIHGPK